MKHRHLCLALAALLIAGSPKALPAPPLINYQGRIVVGTTNHDGTGYFKFALVDGTGTMKFWSNDGLAGPVAEPASAVSLPVSKGLYSVLLGDTTIANMASIPAGLFSQSDIRLRVWFSTTTSGFQLLSPDQRLAPAAYLADGVVRSGNIADNAILTSKIAPGQITSGLIANGAIDAQRLLTTGTAAAGQVLGYSAGGLTWTAPGGGGVWSLNGTTAYYSGGNVGIGTATPDPAYRLSVVGSALMSLSSTKRIEFGTPNAEAGLSVIAPATGFNFNRADVRFDGYTLKLVAGVGTGAMPSTNGIAVTTDGNVGIGTSSPETGLHVENPGITEAKIRSVNERAILTLDSHVPSAGVRTVFTLESGVNGIGGFFGIYDRTAAQVRLSINAGGNVGIGTTSASGKLHVQADTILPAIHAVGFGAGAGVSSGSSSGVGIEAGSVSGTGLRASSQLGRAIYADGHAGQDRADGGFVKAMIHFNSNGTILRGFNSFLSGNAATNLPCGFSVQVLSGLFSGYVIDFGFRVDDRFVSITPSAGVGYGQNGTGGSDPNKIHVFGNTADYTVIVY